MHSSDRIAKNLSVINLACIEGSLMRNLNIKSLVVMGVMLTAQCALAQLTMKDGIASIEDPILLGDGRFEDYATEVAPVPRELLKRTPTQKEEKLIGKLEGLLKSTRAKAFAMVDGGKVVWTGYQDAYLMHERFVSMSVSKSILSVATGVAICKDKLSFDTKAVDLVPELKDKDLGQALIKHLLTMTSGTWEGNSDSSILSQEQRMLLMTGSMNLLQVLTTDLVSSGVQGFFSPKRKPGDVFAYRSTDPLLLAIMLERATGLPYGKFLADEILIPAGISQPAFSGRDMSGFPRADGVLRMKLDDWIRVAIWIKEQSTAETCLGSYLRDATQQKVANRVKSNYPQRLKGYGYFFGLDNEYAPDTYWAVGFAGQEIGWSRNSQKIVLGFANSDLHIKEFEKIYGEWLVDNSH